MVSLPVLSNDFACSMRIEMNTTYRCNAVCTHCDKAVGLARLPNMEMTRAAMTRAVDQLIEQRVRVTRLTFCGGEPVLNREFQGLVNEAARLPHVKIFRLLTNGLPPTAAARAAIRLPNNKFKWIESPLDDPTDPTSGKNKRPNRAYRKRSHLPFWVSPVDVGLEGRFENCRARTWCGKGLDANGWSMCGKAGVFGRLFGIDPYMRDGDIASHVDTPIPELCRHCVYGLPRDVQWTLQRDVQRGKHPFTVVSPTFERAFADYRERESLVKFPKL